MATKFVCDICGADTDNEEFTIPFFIRDWCTDKMGNKLASCDRIGPKKFNLCNKHRLEIARLVITNMSFVN